MSAQDKHKPKPNGELRVALFDGTKLIRIGPRLWAIGAFAALSPQARSVINIVESAVAGIVIYAVLSLASLGFDAADRWIGGIGEIWLSKSVRFLIVEGGLLTSGLWLLVGLVSTAKLAIVTTWQQFVPITKLGGGDDE